MKDAVQPPLVMIGGVLNIVAGLFNLFIGLIYLMLCYGIIVLPVGLWQVIVGGLALTGKRVPTGIVAAVLGAFMSLITFNLFGMMICTLAAIVLAIELFMPPNQG